MATVAAPDRESDVVLRDGSIVRVRPAIPADESSIRAFLGRLSPESLHLRFGSAAANLDAAARQQSRAASRDHVSVLAVTGADHVVVGEAGYERLADDRAEIALVIADQYHGHGLGTNLLGLLAGIADADGIRSFEAEVLPENGPMLDVFRESGLPARIRSEPGVVRVEISTSMTPDARDRFEHREELSAAAAVRTLLCPRSIAVIGASRNRQTIGGRLFRNLIDGEFTGPVYPVNPAARSVQGVRAYGSILEIPDSIDVALVVVPAEAVARVARDCARHGVKGLVVISAGFSEVGAAGAERQAELLTICREAGMRLIGPNCMGVSNTAADVNMNGQFAPIAPMPGNVGFLSQSGALGLALIDHANRLGLGLSTFVSVGNKADLSGNDFLCYWEGDAATDVILLPWQPELAIGAVAEGNVCIVNDALVEETGVSGDELVEVIGRERVELERRVRAYRGERSPIRLDGRVVILVDDGLATGYTARAAIKQIRRSGASRVVLAVPVAPEDSVATMGRVPDEIMVLQTPPWFLSIGEHYEDFRQTSDEDVVALLQQAATRAASRAAEVPAAA